jgi:hypothetical protein
VGRDGSNPTTSSTPSGRGFPRLTGQGRPSRSTNASTSTSACSTSPTTSRPNKRRPPLSSASDPRTPRPGLARNSASDDPASGRSRPRSAFWRPVGYADVVASTIRSGAVLDDPTGTPGPMVRCACDLAGSRVAMWQRARTAGDRPPRTPRRCRPWPGSRRSAHPSRDRQRTRRDRSAQVTPGTPASRGGTRCSTPEEPERQAVLGARTSHPGCPERRQQGVRRPTRRGLVARQGRCDRCQRDAHPPWRQSSPSSYNSTRWSR